MRDDDGTADIFLLIVLLGGTLLPAAYVSTPDWLDTLAGQILLYGGAITVAVAGWRKARRLLAYVRHGWTILTGLDDRVGRMERRLKHMEVQLGLTPLPEGDEA